MAHLFYFTRGGFKKELGSGSPNTSTSDRYKLLEYTPRAPDMSTIDTNSIIIDGGRRVSTTRRNVTENATVLYSGSSHEDIQTAFQDLQRFFFDSESYVEKYSGSPGYAVFAPYGSTSPYRSQILGGNVELTNVSLDTRWTNGMKSIFSITFTREYFWEGSVQTAKITNSNGTATGSLRVDNLNDASEDNFVIIHGSTINGDMPTPAKIWINNNTGSTRDHREYILAHGISPYNPDDSNVLTKLYTFEGEDAQTIAGAASDVANADCSGGEYCKLPYGFTSTGGDNAYLGRWSVYDYLSDVNAGKTLAVIGRTHGTPDTQVYLYITPVLRTTDTIISRGAEITVFPGSDYGLMNFGVITFPKIPGDASITPENVVSARYSMSLQCRDNTGTVGLSYYGYYPIDFVALLPTDGFRTIRNSSGCISNGYSVILDEIEGICYQTDTAASATAPISKFSVTGKQINLVPKVDQTLSLFVSGCHATGSAYSGSDYRSLLVQYRPRRTSI